MPSEVWLCYTYCTAPAGAHAGWMDMRRLSLLLILLLVATTSWAQTYKWRDPSGRIQYSDTPPPAGAKDVQQLRKTSPGPGSSAPTTAGKSLSDQDAAFRKRLVEQKEGEAKQQKAAEEEQMRARNCEQAKGQLAALDSGGRMMQFNEKGERLVLDDAGRERARADAQKAVDAWCK